MGNRANRKRAGEILKRLGLPKNHYMKESMWPNSIARRIIKVLADNDIGDIVSDCDGLNHIIVGLCCGFDKNNCPIVWNPGMGPLKENNRMQFVFADGLVSCSCYAGIGPPRTKTEIETDFFNLVKSRFFGPGGVHTLIYQQILAGKEYIDENGLLLPEILEKLWK